MQVIQTPGSGPEISKGRPLAGDGLSSSTIDLGPSPAPQLAYANRAHGNDDEAVEQPNLHAPEYVASRMDKGRQLFCINH